MRHEKVMRYEADPKQIEAAIYESLAEASIEAPVHQPRHFEGVDMEETGIWILQTGGNKIFIGDEHLDALHSMLHERAASVGVVFSE